MHQGSGLCQLQSFPEGKSLAELLTSTSLSATREKYPREQPTFVFPAYTQNFLSTVALEIMDIKKDYGLFHLHSR